MFLWFGFIVCTSLIVYSGTKLAKYGDIIAEKDRNEQDVDRPCSHGIGYISP